jgi:hypothetical protein
LSIFDSCARRAAGALDAKPPRLYSTFRHQTP